MKALSIRQPWAWLIVNGHKDIENRTWSTRVRGEILVHASAGMTRAEYDDVEEMLWLGKGFQEADAIRLPEREKLKRGGIVGKVTIADCVYKSESRWFFGPQGFLLRDASVLPFVPYKGALGFFEVPDALVMP